MSSNQRFQQNKCVHFANRGLRDINFAKFFQMNDAFASFLFNLQNCKNIQVTIYKSTATIRNKVCKCQERIESINQ